MDFVSFVMVNSYVAFSMKEVKVLETNQQGIGDRNTVTPNIIYHDVL